MHPDPVCSARPLGHADAIVADAQEALPVLHAQADFDPLCASVGHGIVHRLLRDAIEVRLDLGAKTVHGPVTLERAGDAKAVVNIECQGLERRVETGLVQALRAETAGQVAGLADGLVQQCVDLAGVSSRGGFGPRASFLESVELRAAIPASVWHRPSCSSRPRRSFS